MKKLAILIFVFCSMQGSAQVPGYQGYRFLLSYDAGIVPGVLTHISQTYSTENLGIFLHHNITAEYVLDRKFSLGAEFTFFQDKPTMYAYDQYSYPEHYSPYTMTVTALTIGIDAIIYAGENNPLAPVGNFFKLKLFTTSYSADVQNVTTETDPVTGYNNLKLTPTAVTGQTAGFGVGFGQNHVIYNRIVLNAGLDLDFNIKRTDNGSNIASNAYSHILLSNIVYLKLGVGGLLF